MRPWLAYIPIKVFFYVFTPVKGVHRWYKIGYKKKRRVGVWVYLGYLIRNLNADFVKKQWEELRGL